MKKFYILISTVLFVFLCTNEAKPQEADFNIADLEGEVTYSKLVEHGLIQYEYDNPIPPGWDFSTSDKVHIISVKPSSNPQLCGVPIEPGDFIGLFFIGDDGEEYCGGCAEWTGTEAIPLIGYGDDTYTNIKDGFDNGETMIWYVYSYSQNGNIYPAIPEYNTGYGSNNKFYSGGLSIVDEQLEYFYPNDIIIPKGWSGLSSFTKTSEQIPIIYKVLAPILDDMIIIQDMQKIYYPAAGINTMFLWTNGKGYKIKMAEEAVFPMMGCPVDSRTVSLSTTWNILPVLSECNVLASDVFSPIESKIIVVKEIAGSKVYWPAMGIETLQVLEPGKAYYMAVSQSASLTYEDCLGLKGEIVPQQTALINLTPWSAPVNTGFTHTIAFSSEAYTEIQAGDFIGAFTENGYCAGLTQIDDLQKNTSITVYGDDITTPEVDGISEGEQIVFKIYRTNSNEEASIIAAYDAGYAASDGNFYDNGLSVVNNLKLSSTGLSEISRDVNFYPNPTNGIIEIRVENEDDYDISIQSINGQVIVQQLISGSTQINLSDCSKGVYMVIIENDNSRRVEKLVIK